MIHICSFKPTFDSDLASEDCTFASWDVQLNTLDGSLEIPTVLGLKKKGGVGPPRNLQQDPPNGPLNLTIQEL